jgi:hypothetical protein
MGSGAAGGCRVGVRIFFREMGPVGCTGVEASPDGTDIRG